MCSSQYASELCESVQWVIGDFIRREVIRHPWIDVDELTSLLQFTLLDCCNRFRNVENFDRSHFIRYLRRACRNKSLRLIERANRHWAYEVNGHNFDDACTEDTTEQEEKIAAVYAAIQELEPKLRKIMLWTVYDRLTDVQIGKRLKVSKQRIAQLRAIAREKLKTSLQELVS